MKKNILVGVIVLIVVILISLATNLLVTPKLQAIPGNEVTSNCLTVGGVETCSYSKNLNNASTTLCSFPAPRAASSTLVFAGIDIGTSSTSAYVLDIGISSYADATTTLIGTEYALTASERPVIIASTTPTLAATNFTDKQYLNFKIGGSVTCTAGATAACNSFKGKCKAVFIKTSN
jgi:hypothetical protein